MIYTVEIPGRLPSLNDYVRAERSNRHSAAKIKRETEDMIVALLNGAPSFDKPVLVLFDWIRDDMRTDKDNVAFAKKFVLDALQSAGVISRDSWSLCTPFDRRFAINRTNPRTIVTITDEMPEGTNAKR